MRSAFLCLACILVCCLSLRAQDPNATVSGRVLDPSGAVVPGTQIRVINDATNIEYSTVTNDAGIYSIPSVPPDKYHIQVSRSGFKTMVKPDVVLHVQDALTINFTLEIGAASESVTVEGGAPLVNTESAAVSTVIDRQFVESLPLNGRSFNTLLQLTPGVVIVPASIGAPGQFSVNGQRTNASYFMVDGVSANFGVSPNQLGQQGGGGTVAFSVFGGTNSLVSVDAVQEFRVQTSSFAPEYGRTPGGQVSIETRSGTNQLHGGAFDYFRNDVLDANDWFNNATIDATTGKSIPKAKDRQNDFGGFLGGPVFRNKTFIFFSYEGLRLRQPQTRVLQVPSEYARTNAVAAAAPYLDAVPQPDDRTITPGVYTAPFTASFSNEVTLNTTSMRVDHSFNSKWLLFGRFNDSPSVTSPRQGGSSVIVNSKTPTKTTTVGLTALLNPRLTNSFRGNYSVQHGDQSYSLDSFGGAVPLDPTLLLPPPLSPRTSYGHFQTTTDPTLDVGLIPDIHERQVNLVDDLAFSSGSHRVKFGVDWRRLNFFFASNPGTLLDLSFSVQNFVNTGAIDLLVALNGRGAKILLDNLSFYGQDTWEVNHRLSLTYGLRWELDPAPSALDGTKLGAWQNVDNPSAVSLAPFGTPVWNTTYGNFAPRIGAAYRITKGGDFVLRGGWGIFYDLGTSTVTSLAGIFPNSGFSLVPGPIQLPVSNAGPYIPAISFDPKSSPFELIGFSPNISLPRSSQWNVALEKSFASTQAISVTYVGQAGRDLLRREDTMTPASNPNLSPGTLFVLTRNGDSSDYDALQIQYRRPMSRGVQALLSYTWSHSIDTGSDDSVDVNSHLIIPGANDRGSSSFDVRHSFTGALAYAVPHFSREPILSGLTRNWSLNTVVVARTGLPFDVETSSVSIPGITRPTRADLVPGQPIWLSGSYPGGKRLNFNAFSIPAQPRQGTLGRNAIAGFGLTQVDLSLARKFSLTERLNLQFRSDFFNVLNHPNFANPGNSLDDPASFGLTSIMLSGALGGAPGIGLSPLYQIGGPRSIQLSMKIQF